MEQVHASQFTQVRVGQALDRGINAFNLHDAYRVVLEQPDQKRDRARDASRQVRVVGVGNPFV